MGNAQNLGRLFSRTSLYILIAISFSCNSSTNTHTVAELESARKDGIAIGRKYVVDSVTIVVEESTKKKYYEFGYDDGYHKRPKSVENPDSVLLKFRLTLVAKTLANCSLIAWIVYYIRSSFRKNNSKERQLILMLSIIMGLIVAFILKISILYDTHATDTKEPNEYFKLGGIIVISTIASGFFFEFLFSSKTRFVSQLTELLTILLLSTLLSLTAFLLVQDILSINYYFSLYHCVYVSICLGMGLYLILDYARKHEPMYDRS